MVINIIKDIIIDKELLIDNIFFLCYQQLGFVEEYKEIINI